MSETDTPPRLNGLIRALEDGGCAFGCFTAGDPGAMIALAASAFDGVIIELEHNVWDATALRVSLQFMLDRGEIARSGSVAPRVTPIVRIPANGGEMNQWQAKQALDLGAYGIVWPQVDTVEQARNAVAACRYARLPTAPLYDPPGARGDGPTAAIRYWGVDRLDYYKRADVWPLDPAGEILVVLMIESVAGVENLDAMLAQVPGIGAVLIGESDLSHELGLPRQYEHPLVLEAMAKVVATCAKYGVPVGHPHVTAANAERLVSEGYRLLLAAPTTNYGDLNAARRAAGVE